MLIVCLGLIAGLAGCPEDDDGPDPEALADGAISLAQESNATFSNACDCWEEWGFASEEMCMMAVGVSELMIDRACLVDAISMDPEAVSANFECERASLEELIACNEAALDACDSDALQACSDMPEPECPALSAEVDAAIDACFTQG